MDMRDVHEKVEVQATHSTY